MNFNISDDLCNDIIDIYGSEHTTVVAMEECAEVIQELSKFMREKGNEKHLAEEIGDALMALKIVCMVYDIKKEDIQNSINYKQDRQVRRNRGVE